MHTFYRFWAVPLALGGIVVWAYWTTLGEMAERWFEDPQYSHGYLVPLFSVFLLWFRRKDLQDVKWEPSWYGIGLLIVGLGLWAAGTYVFVKWFAEISLLFCVAGLFVVVGGWPALRWSWPAVLFLGFMVPLPYFIQTKMGSALQAVATRMSTFALQTFGAPAIAEGNVILVQDVHIGVVEACSGLGMLMTFFALSTGLALLVRSAELWLRIVVVISAVPVAVFANVVRITVTGLLYNAAQHDLARIVFHDVAGWLMMPLALGILFGEIYLLKRLVVDRNPPTADLGAQPWLPEMDRGNPPS